MNNKMTEKEALRQISELAGRDNVKITDEDFEEMPYMKDEQSFKREYQKRLERLKGGTKQVEVNEPKMDKVFGIECVPEQSIETTVVDEEIKPVNMTKEEACFRAKVSEITEAMTEILCYKNKKYGNAALQPMMIFSKVAPFGNIPVRIDDKLARIKNSDSFRVNDICDLIGYLYLLLIAMGATEHDIEKLKD